MVQEGGGVVRGSSGDTLTDVKVSGTVQSVTESHEELCDVCVDTGPLRF